jgi:hypothetical protein
MAPKILAYPGRIAVRIRQLGVRLFFSAALAEQGDSSRPARGMAAKEEMASGEGQEEQQPRQDRSPDAAEA